MFRCDPLLCFSLLSKLSLFCMSPVLVLFPIPVITERSSHKVGTTGDEHQRAAIRSQGALLGSQQEQLCQLGTAVRQLSKIIQEQHVKFWPAPGLYGDDSDTSSSTPDSVPAPDPVPLLPTPQATLPAPQQYDWSPEICHGFLAQCSLVLEMQAIQFPTDSMWRT